MNAKLAALLLLGSLVACVQAQPPETPAPAPPPAPPAAPAPAVQAAPGDRTVVIRRATCDTYLALAPDDRAAATLFYIGCQASRLRSKTIDVNAIPAIETQAIKICNAYPDRTVAWAFADAYLHNR